LVRERFFFKHHPVLNMRGFSKPDSFDVEWQSSQPDPDDRMLVLFWSSGCARCFKLLEELERIGTETDVEPVAVHRNEHKFQEPHIADREEVHVAEDDGLWEELGNSFSQNLVLLEDREPRASGGLEDVLEFIDEEVPVSEPSDVKEYPLGYRKGASVNGRGAFIGSRKLGVPKHRPEDEPFLQGRWFMDENHLSPEGNSKLYLKSRAEEFHVSAEGQGEIKVLLDGRKPGERSGDDLDSGKLAPSKGRSFEVVSGGEGLQELVLIPEGDVRIHSISTREIRQE
jgi:thiol-disulfide isomerase/thioredoxin